MTVLPKRFRRNTIANYVSSIVAILLALLVTPVLVRGLGKEAYGVWALATSWALYFNLLQLGAGRATVKFVAEFRGRGDLDRVRRTIATSFFGLSIPGTLLLLAIPGLAYLFVGLFDIPAGLETAAFVLVILAMVDLAIAIPADTFGAALAGYERYDLLAATVTGTAIAQAVAWTIIVVAGGGLIPIGVATITFSLLSQVVRFFIVRYLAGGNPIRIRNFDRGFLRPLLTMSGWIAVAEFSAVFIGQIDVIIVGLVASVPAAGVYAVGLKLSTMPARLTGPMTSVFFPHAAGLAATGNREEFRRMMFTGTRIAVAVAAPLAIAVSVLAKPTIDAWVGAGFDGAAPVVICISSAAVIYAMFQVPGYSLRALGDVKYPALFAALEAALNFGLSIALGLTIGPTGVALATLIARAVTELLIAIPYACMRTGTPLVGFYWGIGRRILPASGASLAVGLLLLQHGINGILQVIVAGCVMVATYAAVLLLTGVSTGERRAVFAFVGRRVGGD